MSQVQQVSKSTDWAAKRLVAFGATAGIKALAIVLNSAFKGISTTLGSYISQDAVLT